MNRLSGDKFQSRPRLKKTDRERRPGPPSEESIRSETVGFKRPGAISLMIHLALVVFVLFSLRSGSMRDGPDVYRVTIRPLLGDGKPPGGSGSTLPGAGGGSPSTASVEKPTPVEIPKEPEVSERSRFSQKKTERKPEKPDKGEVALSSKAKKPHTEHLEVAASTGLKPSTKKEEKPKEEKGPNRSLQEAIEDIHKKVALDAIQKKVAQREAREKSSGEGGTTARPYQGPIISSSGNVPGSGPGTGTGPGGGTGTGSGSGTGTGTGVGSGSGSGGVPWGSRLGGSSLDSRLSEYYDRIWTKIKEEWTLPQDLPKGKTDFETIIVIIVERDGKIQKSWFEKRSGNSLYDQMAMRAIKKAEPLPPIPKEFGDETFEIGIRFHPE